MIKLAAPLTQRTALDAAPYRGIQDNLRYASASTGAAHENHSLDLVPGRFIGSFFPGDVALG